MNNLIKATQGLLVTAMVMLTASCADLNLVSMDSTAQLKDLRDLDRDGVIEARENCDDTLLGSTIDNVGCGKNMPVNQSMQLDIKFENNSAVIPAGGYSQIQNVANFLGQYPNTEVIIEGHTSKVGSAELNQKLSEQRAAALAAALVNEFNIEQVRVSTVGYGFSRPKDNSESDEAHAINRRIVAELSGDRQVSDMIWTIYTVDQTE